MKRRFWDCNHDRTEANTTEEGRCATCALLFAFSFQRRMPHPSLGRRNAVATGFDPFGEAGGKTLVREVAMESARILRVQPGDVIWVRNLEVDDEGIADLQALFPENKLVFTDASAWFVILRPEPDA